MLKVFVLVINSVLAQATGPVANGKMLIAPSQAACIEAEEAINATPFKDGLQTRAKCIILEYDNRVNGPEI